MAVASGGKHLWGGTVRQVTKSNFVTSLQQFKGHIRDADFIAVSSQKTGDFAASSSSSHRHPWRRLLPIDTPETAYLKAKLAAETFELLQFAVCPFRIEGSKVLAYPYNFHLFPRDELNLGMPSYSFSCQTSFLTSMAREGFDFNVCIYDGISYLSRVQESKAKERNRIPVTPSMTSSPSPSVADSVFMGRIKSRVEHWWNACKDTGKTTDDPLIKSLRKLILGSEVYGSRPCMSIDVCSDRQVQLVLEMVNQICDDLVPLIVPEKSEPKMVRVVLTSSEEDKNNLMSEVQYLEEEQNLKIRGFREVIDLISNSHKPIIAYNCLHDFTFIHSKFLAPLPPTLTEFMCSLRLVFSNILDVNHLLKEVGPLRKSKNLPAALSYLRRQFFVPIDMEIPQQAEGNTCQSHGNRVLRITHLFAKLSNLLKIAPGCQSSLGQQTTIEDYTNTFYPCCSFLQEPGDEDAGFWTDNVKRTTTDNLVFLWGFCSGVSATELKCRLREAHAVFSEDFELQLVDKTCAVAVFWRPASAETFLNDMRSENIGSCALTEMVSDGLRAAGYDAYWKVCRMGLWEADLADSLDMALSESANDPSANSRKDDEIYWCSDSMIYLNDL